MSLSKAVDIGYKTAGNAVKNAFGVYLWLVFSIYFWRVNPVAGLTVAMFAPLGYGYYRLWRQDG